MTDSNEAKCPFGAGTAESNPAVGDIMAQSPEQLRAYMFNWYQKSGFRGCLFNKVAARDARRGEFIWHTPVSYGSIEDITSGAEGSNVLDCFDRIIADGNSEGLVSYMFPGINTPKELGDLLKYLHEANPDRFRLLGEVDREVMPGFGTEEFVGIQFRVKVGQTQSGEDALAYPMVYNPWDFTTFARRFDVPMITFNVHNSKQNPETPDTYIGVDDIDLTRSLDDMAFTRMLQRSVAIRKTSSFWYRNEHG